MKGCCVKCGALRESLHKDHVVPKWRGGADEPSNWQYLCANCHEDKTREEHRSKEYRDIVSARHLGSKWSDAQRKAQSNRQLGKKRGPRKKRWSLTEEQKERQRASWTPERRAEQAAKAIERGISGSFSFKGRQHSEEARARISATLRKRSEELVVG